MSGEDLLDEFDIYGDLESYHEVESKKNEEISIWEEKCNGMKLEIEGHKATKSALKKEIKTIKLSFQAMLDTARAEIARKDAAIVNLRREKDDLCFKRKRIENNKFNDIERSANSSIKVNPFRVDSVKATMVDAATQTTERACISEKSDNSMDKTHSNARKECDRKPGPNRDYHHHDRSRDRGKPYDRHKDGDHGRRVGHDSRHRRDNAKERSDENRFSKNSSSRRT